MTRISVKGLVDESDEENMDRSRQDSLERRAHELMSSMEQVRRRKERSLESRARKLHFRELSVRDRSPGGRDGESKEKRRVSCSLDEDNLIFEVIFIDRDGLETTVSAFGLPIEEAAKLSWKFFKNYMIKNSGLERAFSRKSEVKVFYVDEEEDEIFVDTDDEYKEMIKVAAEKKKTGTMVLNLLSVARTRRGKVDLLAREARGSPGKITKKNTNTKVSTYETLVNKVWKKDVKQDDIKTENSKRAKLPNKPVNKAIKLTVGYTNDDIEETGSTSSDASSSSGFGSQDQDKKFLKERASNFEWLSTRKQKREPTPLWFHEYMESYKDELTAEITAQVVKSLGVVLDNKLCKLLNKNEPNKRKSSPGSCIETVKRKGSKEYKKEVNKNEQSSAKPTVKKVETESKDKKELKSLEKSIMKKADRVAKLAKKMEKKKVQEDRRQKGKSLSSSESEQDNDNISDMSKNVNEKKEKPKPKNKKKHEMKKALTVNDIKLRVKPNMDEIIDNKTIDIALPTDSSAGLLSPALYLLEKNKLSHDVKPGQTIEEEIHIINMSAMTWWEGYQPTCQRSFSSNGLESEPSTTLDLPHLKPGTVGTFSLKFTAPENPGKYESVWHFYKEQEVFGPALKFDIKVEDINHKCTEEEVIGTEMKDFGGQIDMDLAQEMKKMGCQTEGTEMIEMKSSKEIITIENDAVESDLKISSEQKNNTTEKNEEEDEFDLLASEVDSLDLSASEKCKTPEKEDDFELIPIPSCFNLDIPFEIVGSSPNSDVEEDEDDESEQVLSKVNGFKIIEVDSLSAFEEGNLKIDVKIKPSKYIVDLEEDEKDLDESESALSKASSFNIIDHDVLSAFGDKNLKIDVKVNPSKYIIDVEDGLNVLEDIDDCDSLKIDVDMTKLTKLVNLGFANREENIKLLRANNNDLEKVLESLCFSNSKSWSEVRH